MQRRPQSVVLAQQVAVLDQVAQLAHQLLVEQRLQDVVVGAGAQRLHGGLDAGVSRYQEQAEFGIEHAGAAHQFDAIDAG